VSEAEAVAHLRAAHAHARQGDAAGAIAAVDAALALQPRNVVALILKADQLAAIGDARAASAFYRAVVESAPPAHEMPAQLRDAVARAAAMCDHYTGHFEAYLRERLASKGTSARFAESLDILNGRKRVYFQEPRQYFFPGLPQIQFYGREPFPWLDLLESATDEIRAELMEVLKQDSAFQPYVQRNSRLPHTDAQGLLDNPAWSAFYLWQHGEAVAENAARCPRTVQALAGVPLAHMGKRGASVLFSLLQPGAHIPPHTGEMNTRLICHLPLVVPEGCHLRVGNETRTTVEGKAWVFDDTIEHEAWNRSDRTRVILLLEVWRPELSADERALVGAMFEAIDGYGRAA
jgi:aspartate beta-hydroxylase